MRAGSARQVGALLLLLLASACTSGATAGSETAPQEPLLAPDEAVEATEGGGTLRWALPEPEAIVPFEAVRSSDLVVVSSLFEPLTRYGPDGNVVAGVAGRWRANFSSDVWTFFLRPDARFHNGAEVTAADFKFSWEEGVRQGRIPDHLRDVAGFDALRRGEARTLAGVVALDDHTLEITLSTSRADLPAVLAHLNLAPVPREAWEADPVRFSQRPVGNGAFEMVEAWAHGRFIRVSRVAEPGPSGGEPTPGDAPAEEVLFRFTDPDTGYVAFQQGRVDVTEVPPGALSQAMSTYGTAPDGYTGPGVLRGDTPVLYFLGMDLTKPPFDDVEVRRALSFAIDRGAIVGGVLEGSLRSARSAVPPPVPGFRPNVCRACVYSPNSAEQIFADRGISELTLWFNSDGGHEPIAQQIRSDLAEVGVRLVFRRVPFPEYLDALDAGEPSLFRFGWTTEYATLDDALRPLFHSAALPGPDALGGNYGGYADEEVDALLDRARQTRSVGARTRLLQEAEDLVLNRDLAIIPLATFRHRLVVSERVEGFRFSPYGIPNLATVRVRGLESRR